MTECEIPLAVKPPADAKTINTSALSIPCNPTPPLTPMSAEVSSSAPFLSKPSKRYSGTPTLVSPSVGASVRASTVSSEEHGCSVGTSPLQFDSDLELRKDVCGNPIEYGRGAWSVVHSATCRGTSIDSTSPPSTPPISPPASVARIFAVKSPLRRDGYSIMRAEAQLLTRLSRIPRNDAHLVPFHGYILASHSLVMTAIPLTLADHIMTQAGAAAANFSTKTMFSPIFGMAKWFHFAEAVVKGLHWLHTCAQVVHGDVKPQNILLRPRKACIDSCSCKGNDTSCDSSFPFDPLFMDFTSSYDLTCSMPWDKGLAGSALTPPFAAPELLTVSSLASSDIVPSKASDIFSLAVTLLAAATGELLLYPGVNSMQRLAMSRDGHRVLEHVRSTVRGSRVPRHGTVEKVVSPALAKDPERRVTATEWCCHVRAEGADGA